MIKINNLLQIDEDLSSLLKFVYLRGSRTALGQVGFTARNIHTRRIRASMTGDVGIQFIPSTFELDPGQVRTVLLNVSDVAFLETLPVGTSAVDFKISVNEILPPVIFLPEPVIPGIPPTPTIVLGCLDPNATNYNSSANISDGSCNYQPTTPPNIRGCTDRNAINFNPYASENDGTCRYQTVAPVPPPAPVYGCTDPAATNYNPTATVNTGCLYPQRTRGCTNRNALNYNSLAEIDDGSCILPGRWILSPISAARQTTRTIITQISQENFQEATAENNFTRGYYYTEYGYTETTYYGAQFEYQLEGDAQTAGPRPQNPTQSIDVERGNVVQIVNRFLRGPDIVFQVCDQIGIITQEISYAIDGPKAGYKNICRLIQNPSAPGGCLESCVDEFVGVYGCTDPNAANFNPSATLNDGSCRPVSPPPRSPIFGCTDPNAANFNPSATLNDGSCRPFPPRSTIFGCRDINAINYNPDANTDDGSCEYTTGGTGTGGGDTGDQNQFFQENGGIRNGNMGGINGPNQI